MAAPELGPFPLMVELVTVSVASESWAIPPPLPFAVLLKMVELSMVATVFTFAAPPRVMPPPSPPSAVLFWIVEAEMARREPAVASPTR